MIKDNIKYCYHCGVLLTRENDSGWEVFTDFQPEIKFSLKRWFKGLFQSKGERGFRKIEQMSTQPLCKICEKKWDEKCRNDLKVE